MTVLFLILYVLAAFCFLAFALNIRVNKIHLLGFGVFFWSLVPLIQTFNQLT